MKYSKYLILLLILSSSISVVGAINIAPESNSYHVNMNVYITPDGFLDDLNANYISIPTDNGYWYTNLVITDNYNFTISNSNNFSFTDTLFHKTLRSCYNPHDWNMSIYQFNIYDYQEIDKETFMKLNASLPNDLKVNGLNHKINSSDIDKDYYENTLINQKRYNINYNIII
ncbi:MAG: hypothetical protein LBT10_08105 [Methanobrevibacter sp.]|jgi:hypothetical protein|nr:hypothetical protein [Methanobrevibacter sp.]